MALQEEHNEVERHATRPNMGPFGNCRCHPEVMQLLNKYLLDHHPSDLGMKQFPFTSININKAYNGRLHRDGNNVGPSILKAFGDFTGGALRYYPNDDRSR